MPLDLPALIEDVHRGRRTVLAIAVVLAALMIGTLVGPLMGGAAAAGLAPTFGVGVSDRTLTTAVFLGSLVFSVPISVFLLGWSVVWHLRVRRALQAQGVPRPAVGIVQPARFAAVPLRLGTAVSAIAVPVALLKPWPQPGTLSSVLVGAALVVWMALGPLVGLLVGMRRGLDRAATHRLRRGELTAADIADDGRSFPLIDRRARSVVRAELLRRDGELDAAEATLRAHVQRSGVGPQETLLTWARVHRDAGRTEAAEQALAAAARLVPIDVSALRLLADMRRDAGELSDARHIDEEVAALTAGNLGLVFGGAQRVQA